MKALVVYDSVFGNTEKIARQIGTAIGDSGEVRTVRVGEASNQTLEGVELLIVGSPTRKFRPTEAITSFLKRIPASGLQGVRAAAFDTRVNLDRIGSRAFRFVVGHAGYAAKPIARRLESCGATISTQPEGFLVEDSEGPLKEGELERAASWGSQFR